MSHNMDTLKHTHDIIHIKADPDLIFRLAADVTNWPRILPHYRWVKVIERTPDSRTVEMAARRGRIPVSWRAVQSVDASAGRIVYKHTKGATRGMYVEWTIEPLADGTVRVEIMHDLSLETPLVRSPIGKLIVARIFISYIASRTLSHIKNTAEMGQKV